jgi:hypothetical protein
VTKETAETLKEEKIKCSFRDIIDVKGKGKMSTYFVDLTPDLDVVAVDDEEPSETGWTERFVFRLQMPLIVGLTPRESISWVLCT